MPQNNAAVQASTTKNAQEVSRLRDTAPSFVAQLTQKHPELLQDEPLSGADVTVTVTQLMNVLSAESPVDYADLAAQFPGLIDGESGVNGGDLIDWLTSNINEFNAQA